MADQYNYSFDVNAFLETVKEDIAATPEPTGVMAPSKAKAKEVPEVSPFEKLKTDFAKAVQGSYADPEELRRIYSERRKADPVPTREMTLADWDAAAKRSADEVAQAREMAGITRSRTTDYAGNPPADPNWINRQAIVRDDMGGVAIKQPEPVSIIGEQPPKVRPVGREDMLEGAGLASPMGGPNRGSVRPAEEEEATTGEGLMSRRLDSKGETPESLSIMGKIKNIDVSTEDGTVDMSKVQDAITSVVGRNIHSAALLGAIKTEVGSGVKDESPYYSLAGAEGSWRDADVADALATLPSETQTRLKNGKAAGEGRGNWTSTSADRKLLGEAMFDKKYEGGKKYKGRGLIQITHKSTYEEVGKRLGLDLVANPELVNDPKYAVPAAIAYMDYKGYFDLPEKEITKNKLQQLINPGAKTSIKNERWKFAEEFLKDLQGKGGAVKTSLRPKARPEKATE